MKHDTAPELDADFEWLKSREQDLFKQAVRDMIQACKREPGRIPHWPSELRIDLLTEHPGIYEMTWSFAGPDGRATFEIVSEKNGEPVIRWRRVGDRKIFRKPWRLESGARGSADACQVY